MEAWWALVEESKKYFEAAISEFEALRDDANVALVVNNLGLLERLGALYFELVLQRPHSAQEDAFFQRAVGRFEAAQKAAARTPYPVRIYSETCLMLRQV